MPVSTTCLCCNKGKSWIPAFAGMTGGIVEESIISAVGIRPAESRSTGWRCLTAGPVIGPMVLEACVELVRIMQYIRRSPYRKQVKQGFHHGGTETGRQGDREKQEILACSAEASDHTPREA